MKTGSFCVPHSDISFPFLVGFYSSYKDLWFSYERNRMEFNSIGCIESYQNIGQEYFYGSSRLELHLFGICGGKWATWMNEEGLFYIVEK